MNLVPQVGMVELITLAVLALVIVGPKDLPRLLYGVGKAMGKLRRMADEFRAGFDQMAREVEVEEMRKEIEELKKTGLEEDVRSAMGDVEAELERKPESSGS